MKLLFISLMEGFSWGGSEELWCKVAALALEQKQEVYISVKKWDALPPKLQVLVNNGAHIYKRNTVPEIPGLITRIARKIYKKRAANPWDIITNIQPDAICINMGGPYDIAYVPQLLEIIEKENKPYYIIQQFNYENLVLPESIRVRAKNIFANANAVFFVSERNRKTTERNLVMGIKNAVIISNPANLNKYDSLPFPADGQCVQFASVARLDTAYKGQDLLFEVLSSNKWKERNWKLNIFGEGPDRKYLEELIIFFNLSEHIFLRGKTDDIAQVWTTNHLLIMPSIAEGTPLALIEAMICGRPSVVTNVGGNSAIVKDGITGFIAQAPTTALLDQALERAWMEKNNWSVMGNRAHEDIMNNLDLDSYKKVYSDIITI